MNHALSSLAKLVGYLLLIALIYEIALAHYANATLSEGQPTF
jgi:hypothetical protein